MFHMLMVFLLRRIATDAKPAGLCYAGLVKTSTHFAISAPLWQAIRLPLYEWYFLTPCLCKSPIRRAWIGALARIPRRSCID